MALVKLPDDKAQIGPIRRSELQSRHDHTRRRTLAPPEEAKVPGVSLAGSGLYRQMEVTTIGDMMETFAAILIGIGAFAAVILGFIIVVAAGWFIQASR